MLYYYFCMRWSNFHTPCIEAQYVIRIKIAPMCKIVSRGKKEGFGGGAQRLSPVRGKLDNSGEARSAIPQSPTRHVSNELPRKGLFEVCEQ